MPTKTFFNLPDAKRKVIIHAAKQEFSRVPLYEASIANIIKEADIARGSFYQYCEDKEDLFFYLLQQDAETRRKEFLSHIKNNDGDIFIALIEEFKSMLIEIDNEEAKRFYRHVFLNMNYRTERTFMTSKKDVELYQYMSDIKVFIDTSSLNLINERDLTHIVQISTSVMMQNIIQKFACNLSNEKVIHNYELQLNLLKRGFEKGD